MTIGHLWRSWSCQCKAKYLWMYHGIQFIFGGNYRSSKRILAKLSIEKDFLPEKIPLTPSVEKDI
jgi:hypothetical protein